MCQHKLSAGDDRLTHDDPIWPRTHSIFEWPQISIVMQNFLNVKKFNTRSSDTIFAMPLDTGTGSALWPTWALRFWLKYIYW